MTDETITKQAIRSTLKNKDGTLLYPYNPDYANTDLSNLSTTGQAILDNKADTDLSNCTKFFETNDYKELIVEDTEDTADTDTDIEEGDTTDTEQEQTTGD